MAFGDDRPGFWRADLSTRAGAQTATRQGSMAAFALCVLALLGAALLGSTAGYTTPEGLAAMGGAGVEALIGLIAGLRLRAGKGVIAGSLAVVLTAMECLIKVTTLSFGGVFLTAVITVLLVNGVRGALVLKRGGGFEDDDVAAFE